MGGWIMDGGVVVERWMDGDGDRDGGEVAGDVFVFVLPVGRRHREGSHRA